MLNPVMRTRLRLAALGLAAAAVAAVAAYAYWMRPSGHGMTFGEASDMGALSAQIIHVDCRVPGAMEHAKDGGCNGDAGDTACRARLPLLCLQPPPADAPVVTEDGPLKGWSQVKAGATRPVSGRDLVSAEAAAQLCRADLGEGWNPASLTADRRPGVWAMRGERMETPRPGARYWVVAADRPANCWNSAR